MFRSSNNWKDCRNISSACARGSCVRVLAMCYGIGPQGLQLLTASHGRLRSQPAKAAVPFVSRARGGRTGDVRDVSSDRIKRKRQFTNETLSGFGKHSINQ